MQTNYINMVCVYTLSWYMYWSDSAIYFQIFLVISKDYTKPLP